MNVESFIRLLMKYDVKPEINWQYGDRGDEDDWEGEKFRGATTAIEVFFEVITGFREDNRHTTNMQHMLFYILKSKTEIRDARIGTTSYTTRTDDPFYKTATKEEMIDMLIPILEKHKIFTEKFRLIEKKMELEDQTKVIEEKISAFQ